MKKNCDCEDNSSEILNGNSLKEKMWGAFLQDKKIIINSDIDDSLIEKAVMQVYAFNDIDSYHESQTPAGQTYERVPIQIFINSSGGTLDEAFSLISAVQTSKTPVYTVALGRAMSAGFLILLSGHRRFCQPYSVLMHHQGSSIVGGEFNRISEYSKQLDVYQGIIDDYIIQQTKIKRKKLDTVFSHKQDWYIHSQEALNLGIVHDIYGS